MLCSTPEAIVGNKEIRVLFWRSVWDMPPDLRRVITHLYICDRSLEEAALLLGMPQTALQLLHDMAIDNLRVRARAWQ